ncbi:MAG: cytochrome c [Nitrospirota bacterium]
MNRKNRWFSFIIGGIAASAILSFSAFGGSDDKHHAAEHSAQHKHEHAGSPLIDEMVALDAVFRDVVSAVAMSDGRRVHVALETMHGTMEKTHEGVKHGTVTLKKNADRMNDFVAQDKQFHGKLEDLAKAAHKNDGSAMLALTKDLLDRCVKCHRDFRQP